MNFVAIDFETATADRASACAVGLVVVKKGKITDRFSSLIRPPRLDFNPRNIAIHGITPADVTDKPTFQDLWPQLSKWLGNDLLVAHNAPFDVSVLHHCMQEANLQPPEIKCVCTCAMARQTLPGLQDHKLPTLALLFGIDQDHHKAVADAATCAQIAMLLGRLAEPGGLMQFARNLSDVGAPQDYSAEKANPVVGISIRWPFVTVRGCEDDGDEIEERSPVVATQSDARFAKLKFVFTGEFSTLSRTQAESLVKEKGGSASGSVSTSTDYVVVGRSVLESYLRTGYTTGKLSKAVGLKDNGKKVKIIGEDEFLAMIK
jgi:DNA polymerase III subunit epsilon